MALETPSYLNLVKELPSTFRTEVLSSLIEPILIVGLGVLVGIVLIAMYLPLFQLSTGVN